MALASDKPAKGRILLIYCLKFTHLAVLLFICLGWVFPGRIIHQIHLVFVPLTILQWQLNQGTCLLTNWENQLAQTPPDKSQQQGQFTKKILGTCFDPLPSDQTLKRMIYGIILTAWILSGIRLAKGF
ncbi:MAG: DUF2784 domain-containing protein [Oscillatoriales cyanobacterium RM2_1_1]|nr:DUF2784 domain-containing protein [Oscillatoriales cyanobacterium SM2_3_0]NJO44225.1 DUF2784 domain-containing protein [Oscillatoriales cyanobacterium RM2_1_1]